MADKMTLIFVEKTGHALGVLTHAGNPEAKFEIRDLVGEGLPIRDPETGELWLTVETKWLKSDVFDLVGGALLEYDSYVVETNQPVFHSKLAPTEVKLETTGVTVTSDQVIKKNEFVWVQVENSSGERIAQAQPGDDLNKVVKIGMALQPGDYRVLALVPGFGSIVFESTLSSDR